MLSSPLPFSTLSLFFPHLPIHRPKIELFQNETNHEKLEPIILGLLDINLNINKLTMMYNATGTGCSGKILFFHNSLQPLPRLHRCKRPLKLSTQCDCTVTTIGWKLFVQPIAAACWRGRGGKLSRILEKKTQYLI